MRFSLSVATVSALSIISHVSATRLLQSSSLATCQDNSSFTASLFDVVFTPDNRTAAFNINGMSTVTGNVTFQVTIKAYGYSIYSGTLDPCSVKDLSGLCPMTVGSLNIPFNQELSQADVDKIPSLAYGVPDLDAVVKVQIFPRSSPTVSVACLEARISTNQSVNQKGVAWATAIVAGLALVASAIVSGLGHSNTAAHLSSYALSLFGYFQAVAIVGLVAVPLPPIVQAWTQDFDWTMGIIDVDFVQRIATWYQKATGGTPATIFNTLSTVSVNVQKRGLFPRLLKGARAEIFKRSGSTINASTGSYTVTGIARVAFLNNMESTNLFLTGLIFFCAFLTLTSICVALFKAFCEVAVRANWMKNDKFQDFRNGWKVVLKGILFRLVLIGYPQMTILCLWEFTQVDSPAEVVLAVFMFFGMSATLVWAAVKVLRIAKRSTEMHNNPAYILYSDPESLNKWGFLYVQFRATAYYFIFPVLLYIIVKGMFIAFAQQNGVAQTIALVLIEAIALIGASVLLPWMDKSTNRINVAICAMNFVNAVFLLMFSNVFNQPELATGIMGVLFFLFNAVFALVLLIAIIVVTVLSLIRKNPDTRYQPISDNRASFIKSQTQLNTELDALGATARGDKAHYGSGLDLDDDDDSWSSASMRRKEATNTALPPSTANSAKYRESPVSPVSPSVPMFPGGRASPGFSNDPRTAYNGYGSRPGSIRSTAASPVPHQRPGSSRSNLGPGREAVRSPTNAAAPR